MATIRAAGAERRGITIRAETVSHVATDAQVRAAITRLNQIIGASGGTLAQTQTALQDTCTYVRAIIKLLTGA